MKTRAPERPRFRTDPNNNGRPHGYLRIRRSLAFAEPRGVLIRTSVSLPAHGYSRRCSLHEPIEDQGGVTIGDQIPRRQCLAVAPPCRIGMPTGAAGICGPGRAECLLWRAECFEASRLQPPARCRRCRDPRLAVLADAGARSIEAQAWRPGPGDLALAAARAGSSRAGICADVPFLT